jgi:putative sporulation protein YyaC
MIFPMDPPPSETAVALPDPLDHPDTTHVISEQLTAYLSHIPKNRPIIFVCIGTDRSTGDALGPLVGTRLHACNLSGFHLYGTLEKPVHAVNLQETLDHIRDNHDNPFIIGIDACLGQMANVGNIKVAAGPVKPGAGVRKELPPVGDIHITGTVNVGGFMEFFVLQNTRLNLVFEMANTIAKAIYVSLINSGRIHSFPRTAWKPAYTQTGLFPEVLHTNTFVPCCESRSKPNHSGPHPRWQRKNSNHFLPVQTHYTERPLHSTS